MFRSMARIPRRHAAVALIAPLIAALGPDLLGSPPRDAAPPSLQAAAATSLCTASVRSGTDNGIGVSDPKIFDNRSLALMLAIVGVYGVMAYFVTQRTHEIGVRMALGATARDVVRLTVGQAGRLTAIGVGLGLALSLALGRLIEAGLLGAATSDARLTAALAAILILAALAAGYIPARRAAAIEPVVALRNG